MARTVLTPVPSTRAGVTLPQVAAAAVDLQFLNTGTELLVVTIETDSVVVSLPIAQRVDGVTPDPKTVTVSTGAPVIIGPFPTGIYNQAGGNMFVDLASNTGVTVGVVRVAGVSEE